MNKLRAFCTSRPHFWYQLYWLLYFVWFFWLDRTVQPRYILWCPLDGVIPFCEWFVIPYCSWFVLLGAVLWSLWRHDTPSYDKLCLMMFSGMSFCLVTYMILPNGLQLRPDPAALGRSNPALALLEAIWRADTANNVCPSIHCQSAAAMTLYQSDPSDRQSPYFAPLLAKDFSHQPRTLVITAEFCPLRDEGEAFGERLWEAGNKVKIFRIKDALHGYFSLPARFPQVAHTYDLINRFLTEQM